MSNQVKLHNEVNLVGRILSKQRNLKCNNKKAIRVKLAIPNDCDYELNPNIAYVYIYDDGEINNLLNRSQAIAINGHIESNWNQRIICDVLSIIKEPEKQETFRVRRL